MGFEKAENANTIYYRLDDLEKNSVLKALYKGSFTGGEYNSTTHYFLDEGGQKYGVSGCAELNRKMALIKEDTPVAVTYKGKRKLETERGVVQAHSFWIEQNINGVMEPVIYRSADNGGMDNKEVIDSGIVEGSINEGSAFEGSESAQ